MAMYVRTWYIFTFEEGVIGECIEGFDFYGEIGPDSGISVSCMDASFVGEWRDGHGHP